ncbi:MAG: SBBP repeat-containing protein [Acidobacteriaceae bacterium]
MMSNSPIRSRGDATSLLFAVLFLAGCGSGGTSAPVGPPPSAFPSASTQQWVQQFGPPPDGAYSTSESHPLENLIAGLAVDQSGAVIGAGFTLGVFPGVNTFPGPILRSLVVKFSATGAMEWVREFGAKSGGDTLESVAVDAAGNIFVSGSTLLPGSSPFNGTLQATVAKFDPSGNMLWLRQLPMAGASDLNSIAVDGNGDILVGGSTGPASNSMVQSAVVLKLSGATGDQMWQQQFGTSNSFNGIGPVAVNAAGDVFASLMIGSSSPPTANSFQVDANILKLDGSLGKTIWTQQIAGPSGLPDLYPASLAVDSTGDLILGGGASPSFIGIGFGAFPGEQSLLFKLDGATGTTVWTKSFGTGKGDQISSISIDPNNNILATGTTNGSYEPQYAYPQDIVFLVKVDANGNDVWAQELAGGLILNTFETNGPIVATDASGDAFVSSLTQGALPGFSNPTGTTQIVLAKYGP